MTEDQIKEKERQDYRSSERKKQAKSLLVEFSGFVVVGIVILFRFLSQK